MAMKPPIVPLRLEDVSFAANGMRRIKDVSLELSPTGTTVVIGPNGAGKSLLLRLCHGLIAPTAGRVLWNNHPPEAVRRRQAMVFQRPVLLRRSVTENVAYALRLRGVPGHRRGAIIEKVLARVGLTRFAAEPARRLSGGEQQRLAMARVLALEPEALLCDEATASLDPAAAHIIEDVIGDLARGGVKVIMATHDLGQARRLADEVIFMYRGRVREHAPAATFFAGPENDLAQAFIKGELLWWRRRPLVEGKDRDRHE